MMIGNGSRPLAMTGAGALLAAVLVAGCSTPAAEPTTDPSTSPTAVDPTPTSSVSPTPTAPGVDPDALAAVRESLAASIASGNTAALASWVTDPVQVTIAASEFSEPLSPYEAAAQVDYVIDLTATWDFARPDSTIDLYRAGSYAQHFPADALVGLSSAGAVIAFTMTGTEASAIFLCIDEGLLLP